MQYRSKTAPYKYSLEDIAGHSNPAMRLRKIFVGAFTLLTIFLDAFIISVIVKKGVLVAPIVLLGISVLINIAYFVLNFFLDYDYRVSCLFSLTADIGSFFMFAISYAVIALTHSIDVSSAVLSDILSDAGAVVAVLVVLRFVLCAANIFAAYFVKSRTGGIVSSSLSAVAVLIVLLIGVYGTLPALFSDFGQSYRQVAYDYDENNNCFYVRAILNGVNTDTAFVPEEIDGISVSGIYLSALQSKNAVKIKFASEQPLKIIEDVAESNVKLYFEVPWESIDVYRTDGVWGKYMSRTVPELAKGESCVLYDTGILGYTPSVKFDSESVFNGALTPGKAGKFAELDCRSESFLSKSYELSQYYGISERVALYNWTGYEDGGNGVHGSFHGSFDGQMISGVTRVKAELAYVYKLSYDKNISAEKYSSPNWVDERYVMYSESLSAEELKKQNDALIFANLSDRTGFDLIFTAGKLNQTVKSITDLYEVGKSGAINLKAVWQLKDAFIERFGAEDESQIVKNAFIYGEKVSIVCGATHENVNAALSYALSGPSGASAFNGGKTDLGIAPVAASGVYTVTVTSENNELGVYKKSTVSKSFDLTVAAKTARIESYGGEKTYDGETMYVPGVSISGFIEGEGVNVSVKGEQRNAGTSANVFTHTAKPGTDFNNYSITIVYGKLKVNKRSVELTIKSVETVYGQPLISAFDYKVTSGSVVDGDNLKLKFVTDAVAKAGVYKIGATGANDNYTVNTVEGVYKVLQAELKVTGLKAENKIYDGGKDISITYERLSGKVVGDDVTLKFYGSSDDKNAGLGKKVNVETVLSGKDSANYFFSGTEVEFKADIRQKSLGLTSFSVKNKIYDGTVAAETQTGLLTGAIAGDTVSLGSVSAAFADKNAGSGKKVTVGVMLSGADKDNYLLQIADITADITKKSLTVAANDAFSFVGQELSELTYKVEGLIAGETVRCEITTDADKFSYGSYSVFVKVLEDSVSLNYAVTAVSGKYTVETFIL